MYPILFRIGSFEVTSFGVMVALAAGVGLWLFRRELRRSELPLYASDAGVVGIVGGLLGAKLLWTIGHASDGSMLELLFSRGGLSWFGGLIGGVCAGLAYIVIKRWAVVPILAAVTPALAFGHLIGRIGCFLVGDDYGPVGPAMGRGVSRRVLGDEEQPSLKRRVLNALAKPLFSDLNRRLGPLIAGRSLAIEHHEPVAFGGTYRVVTLIKIDGR